MATAVTASSQAAVEAGLGILGCGGNAVDAAVAAALASCVADPCNTGIGGYGGYMVVAGPHRPAACVRFGLWAPTPLTPEALRERTFPETGPAASAVPNVIAGLARALDEFGSFDWPILVAPAAELAARGVTANRTTRAAFEECHDASFVADCFEIEESDGAGGLVFRQPRLAATLDRLAEHGPLWFYEGPLGELACEAWRLVGLDVPLGDWRNGPDAVEVVPAARFAFDGHTVMSAPLGVTGSACLFAFLEAARRIAAERPLEDPTALATLASNMASVWQYRFATPGGNDFEGVSIEDWIERALSHAPDVGMLGPAPGHTAHLNVLDAGGTLVAVTFTQGPAWFGGRWSPGDSGVIMNAGMRNFSSTSPLPHGGRLFGVSNMSPAVMESRAGGRTAVGSPGARRIPANVALMLARLVFSGYDPVAAVAAGRLHAEAPECVTFEKERLPNDVGAALKARFADVRDEDWHRYFGPLTAISVGPEGDVMIGLDDRAPGFGAVV
jgi:gamma-glutamyltranspeptidase/glutathione hydrolase